VEALAVNQQFAREQHGAVLAPFVGVGSAQERVDFAVILFFFEEDAAVALIVGVESRVHGLGKTDVEDAVDLTLRNDNSVVIDVFDAFDLERYGCFGILRISFGGLLDGHGIPLEDLRHISGYFLWVVPEVCE